jgi:hypothetical protein
MKVVTLRAAKKHVAKLIAEWAEGNEILIIQRFLRLPNSWSSTVQSRDGVPEH